MKALSEKSLGRDLKKIKNTRHLENQRQKDYRSSMVLWLLKSRKACNRENQGQLGQFLSSLQIQFTSYLRQKRCFR